MKIIDLLNKIANGEEVPKKIRIEHWCYKFEWVEHLDNYYDKSADVDLMSVLSMSKEELNYEVKIIEEDKPIEELGVDDWELHKQKDKLNEVIRKVNELKKESDK